MKLRELTPKELEEYEKIEFDVQGISNHQLLLGMISLDFMYLENIHKDTVEWEYLKKKKMSGYPLNEYAYPDEPGFMVMSGMIDAWIIKTMMYQGRKITELEYNKKGKLRKAIDDCVYTFVETICCCGEISTGRCKQMIDFYEQQNEEENGVIPICYRSIDVYKYILSCLEFVGIQRMEKTGEIPYIDARSVEFSILVD